MQFLKPSNASPADYREDIDGLRAIAVLTVVLNHAEFALFGGGYVGVDVFFVISGYLISRIIFSGVSSSSFSLRQFYIRRIRRILPALYAVLLFCLPMAYWLMLPSELVDVGRTGVGAVLFISNLILWRQGGYFDVDANLKPLLHLWSLSVEEQFYIIFPLGLVVLAKSRRQLVVACLIGAALMSFFTLVALHREMPRASFYLLPTRAWEILVGAAIGISMLLFPRLQQKTRADGFITVIGLALIAYATVSFNATSPYPGPLTLIPVFGAALVIWFGGRGHIGDVVLTWHPLRVIGLASYSIYLLHQPVLVYWRLASAGHLNLAERTASLAVIVISGLFMYRTIEVRFRDSSRVSTQNLLSLALLVSVALLISSVIVIQNDGFVSRLPSNVQWENAGQRPKEVCADGNRDWTEVGGFRYCEFGDVGSSETVILLGDSHADALLEVMNDTFIAQEKRGLRVGSDCPDIPGIVYRNTEKNYVLRCEQLFTELLQFIKVNDATVIVSVRWTFRLFPIPGWITSLEAFNSEGGHELEDYREYVVADSNGETADYESKRRAVLRLLDGLAQSSRRVIVVGPVPEIGWNIARLNFSHYRSRGELLSEISIPYSDYVERSRFIDQLLDEYEKSRPLNVVVVRPKHVFCDTFLAARCVAQWNSVPFYFDDDHLSDVGARMLLERIQILLK
jgi:peptidoglycan/LPS O-acetylase OafA/YrhL